MQETDVLSALTAEVPEPAAAIEPAAEPPKPKRGRPRKQPAPKPIAQPSAEPQSNEPPAAVGPLKRFKVGHQNCADAVFTAVDRVDAIEQYKKYAGIISTPHPFLVVEMPG